MTQIREVSYSRGSEGMIKEGAVRDEVDPGDAASDRGNGERILRGQC